MVNKTVKIYERVKLQGKWTDRAVPIPKLKADGMMYLKDDREGKFHISWYEGKIKKWHPTTCTTLSEALRVESGARLRQIGNRRHTAATTETTGCVRAFRRAFDSKPQGRSGSAA